MTPSVRNPLPPRSRHRPPWRQRLVETERGMALGLRSDATLFVHFFLLCVILATGVVLSLSLVEWSILVLAFTGVIAAEMFHQLLKTLWKHEGHLLSRETREALRIGTAAVAVTMMGALTVTGLLFARHIQLMFAR